MERIFTRPNGERHLVRVSAPRVALCGLEIGSETWVDPADGLPVTCQGCALRAERDPVTDELMREKYPPLGPWQVGCCDLARGHAYLPNMPLWTEAEARAASGDR